MPSPIRTIARAAAAACVLAAAGCTSATDNQMPLGIGTGPNSLKQSPCACIELPNDAAEPGFVPPKA